MQKEIKIRLAVTKDKKKVLELLDEFSEYLKAADKATKLGGAMFDEIIGRNDTHIFVAESEEGIIGIATLYLLPNIRHGYHRGHIEDLFVTTSARRKGVASSLFKAVKDYCRDNGVKVIKLDSGNELSEAHSFYEKHGGKTTERFFRFDL